VSVQASACTDTVVRPAVEAVWSAWVRQLFAYVEGRQQLIGALPSALCVAFVGALWVLGCMCEASALSCYPHVTYALPGAIFTDHMLPTCGGAAALGKGLLPCNTLLQHGFRLC
jgi:hypothetical protein